MRKVTLVIAALLAACRLSAQVPVPVPAPPTQPNYIIGSGIGFKPYQTPVHSGSSAFVEGGMALAAGIYGFVRVEMRATDAQMLLEGCKTLPGTGANSILMLCGGPGFGADATNVGLSFAAGGKWLLNVSKRVKADNTWVSIEINVDKTTVPAPVQGPTIVSPVQPNFRVGIFKTF